MRTMATQLRNDPEKPLIYGEAELCNSPRQRLRGEEKKPGILVEPVLIGFCGTDMELVRMGRMGQLDKKFPQGANRLINGHEGLVWVPEWQRFAVVLIRGGDSVDPTRFTEDESYFEYGCDGADGLFSDWMYVNPDMLLSIPDGYVHNGRVDLSFAKRMVFPDPYACMLFQLERMEDLGGAHNFRQCARRHNCSLEEGRRFASEEIFERTVIFGLGTTGMFAGDVIHKAHPGAKIVFVDRNDETSPTARYAIAQTGGDFVRNQFAGPEECAAAIQKALGGKATLFIGTSGSQAEHEQAFRYGVLGCNGIYNSFSLGPKVCYDTMPFGFQNQLIFGSINFRQEHMERAIEMLAKSRYDEMVSLIDKAHFIADPLAAYENEIYAPASPMKTAVIWNEARVDPNR